VQPASVLGLALCTLAPSWLPASQDGWQRVTPDLRLTYPEDHGAHPHHRIEWWYVTGRLEAADGRELGFQLTIFRSGLDPSPPGERSSPLRARQVLAGHLAVTDLGGERTRFAERLRRASSPLASLATDDLDLAVEDWTLRRTRDDRLRVEAGDPATGIGVELTLEPRKPLVRHGDRGYSSKGAEPGNASAYVSWTRLATTGRATIDGETVDVHGTAWFDHEFGTSVLERGLVGWDWFGLHLDDGRDLMLFVLRREDGTHSPASAATWVASDGMVRSLGRDDFEVTAEGGWTSPRSGATYPTRWTITFPRTAEALTVVSRVPDCELGARASSGVVYWEGPVDVSGTSTGRGYGELTGYADSMEGKL